MLVLSRREGERVFIGDGISVTVVKTSGGVVRLGIEAPPEVPVIREELAERLKQPAPPSGSSRQPVRVGVAATRQAARVGGCATVAERPAT